MIRMGKFLRCLAALVALAGCLALLLAAVGLLWNGRGKKYILCDREEELEF